MVKNYIHFVINSTISFLVTYQLFISALRADDYYANYSLYIKDFSVVNEKLSFSKAMIPFKSIGKPICKLETNSSNLKKLTLTDQDSILECLFKEGVFIHSYDTYINNLRKKNYIKIKIPPTPVQVDFNDGLVIIRKIR